jgi:hypothetical protein
MDTTALAIGTQVNALNVRQTRGRITTTRTRREIASPLVPIVIGDRLEYGYRLRKPGGTGSGGGVVWLPAGLELIHD